MPSGGRPRPPVLSDRCVRPALRHRALDAFSFSFSPFFFVSTVKSDSGRAHRAVPFPTRILGRGGNVPFPFFFSFLFRRSGRSSVPFFSSSKLMI